jgi:glutamate N-acetyltransferase / amino-acid N-acetyltransferase
VKTELPATFFRSRWVEAPAHVSELEPTVLPAGFRAAGVAAGIKAAGPGEAEPLDVGLLAADEPDTASAARFTRSGLLGAPVLVSREAQLHRLRGVVASSGNANVADGERGIATARAAQAEAADLLGVEPTQVAIAATGVIARELPRDRLVAGVRGARSGLASDSANFSEAILTTDRWPKRACLDVSLPSGTVRLAAQAKGGGMIAPDFATMFCFVETDAELSAETLDLLTGVTVARSFNRISVDGQLSTSDTVVAWASGASGVRVEPESADELALGEAIDALMRQLALEIVADGEGTGRVGRVVVHGASDAVEPVARAVANSPLVKTALHGADPNFGRILQAVGQALRGYERLVVDLEIEGHMVVSGGDAVPLDAGELHELEQAAQAAEVEYALTIPGEGGEAEVFFSDLSHEYVTINSEYTT